MENKSSWVERFYTHFLGRDLSYAFAGGLFICIVQYAFRIEMSFSTYTLSKFYLDSIGFLLCSYFLGLILSEFSNSIKLVKKNPDLPKSYSNELLLHQDLLKNFDTPVLNRNERTIFLMHVGASVGVSAFWGAIILIIYHGILFYFYRLDFNKYFDLQIDLILAIGLLLFGIYSIMYSRCKATEVTEQWRSLVKKIPKKGKTD
jgi:hypothetical protein